MSVYIDRIRDWGWQHGPSCHLIADTLDELHAFAKQIGLRRSWFQDARAGPHYDLTVAKRNVAVVFGAIEVTDHQFITLLKRLRESVP